MYRNLPINPGTFFRLTDGSLMYNNHEDVFSIDKPIKALLEWFLFSGVYKCKIKHNKDVKKDNGCHFFKYLLTMKT